MFKKGDIVYFWSFNTEDCVKKSKILIVYNNDKPFVKLKCGLKYNSKFLFRTPKEAIMDEIKRDAKFGSFNFCRISKSREYKKYIMLPKRIKKLYSK